MTKQSLASKTIIESNPGTGLPVGFGGGSVAVVAPLVTRAPYVLFVSTKGDTFGKIQHQIPDLQDGDPILVHGESYTRLNPFRFYFIDAFRHFSAVDGTGQIVETTLDAEEAQADTVRWKEHVETVLVVIMPNGSLIPATCTFKTLKTNAANKAIEERQRAEDAESWAALSPEHKVSAAIPVAYGRFIATVTLKRRTFKTGNSGVIASAFTRPTGLADWQALADFYKDAEKKKLCEVVYDRFKDRVADLEAGV